MSQYCDAGQSYRHAVIANLNKEQSQVNVIRVAIGYWFIRFIFKTAECIVILATKHISAGKLAGIPTPHRCLAALNDVLRRSDFVRKKMSLRIYRDTNDNHTNSLRLQYFEAKYIQRRVFTVLWILITQSSFLWIRWYEAIISFQAYSQNFRKGLLASSEHAVA
jgi:hypothetical protein